MQTVVPPNPTFLANMRPLWRHDARLAQRIDELPPDATLEIVPSRAGPPTACVTTSDGRRLFLHSRHDPAREAAEFCRTLERSEAQCVILSGLGLGYHVKALFDAFDDQLLVVVTEPDLVTVKTCLEQCDLSRELETGRLEILTSIDKAAIHERLGRRTVSLMLGTIFAVPPAAREHHAEFHAAARRAITDFAAFARMSLVTLVRNAGITCRNIANNLPTYVSTPPADLIRGRFAGVPAVLVAAGPSLRKNIGQIAALADRVVIIAAQTTLKPLLSEGVRPHFVTSLDFSELSRQFFENIEIPDDLVLVAEPKATWHVVDAFRGRAGFGGRRVILLDNAFARRCLGDDLAGRTPLEPGATVMHLAFYLAQWLGCDPIIFVGQDLAFSGQVYYAPGVAMHQAWGPELGRFLTLEMKEWERIVRHRPILRKVPAWDGGELYTDEQMFTYLEQFERDFARSRATVIDATQGGARKRGAAAMSLAEAAGRYAREPMDAARFAYLRTNWYDASKLAPARARLAARLKELADFRSLCDQTQTLLRELRGLVDRPAEFNRKIARVDELRTLVQDHDTVFQMVRDVSQLGELQKFAADRRLDAAAVTARQRAERQLQRDERFVATLLEGCRSLEKILEESLRRFDEAIEAAG